MNQTLNWQKSWRDTQYLTRPHKLWGTTMNILNKADPVTNRIQIEENWPCSNETWLSLAYYSFNRDQRVWVLSRFIQLESQGHINPMKIQIKGWNMIPYYQITLVVLHGPVYMMTSSNGNIFRITGPLCREFTGHRWIPRIMASDAELWCFLWSTSE